MDEPQVHIVDDDEAVRASLQFLLRTAGLTSRSYESPAALLAAAPGLVSGCIVTDMRMPGMTGLELVRELRARGVALPVVMITGHGDVPLAVEAMRAGVRDFLEKPFEEDVLLASIRTALAGQREDDARAAERARFARVFDSLSGREREVMALVVDGKLNKQIAHELGISQRTVEIYRANVMQKSGAKSLSELVRMALALEA